MKCKISFNPPSMFLILGFDCSDIWYFFFRQILNDCDISIYSMAPCGKCHHVDVATSNLELNISPQTMRTIILTTAKLTKLKLKSNQDVCIVQFTVDVKNINFISFTHLFSLFFPWTLRQREYGTVYFLSPRRSPLMLLLIEV